MKEPKDSPRSADCCDWPKSVQEFSDSAQKLVRDDPMKAVGLAAVAGIILTALPIGRVIVALVRVAFALLRPALFVLGVMKIYEECEKQRPRSAAHPD